MNSETLVLELPESVLLKALRQLSPARLRRLFRALEYEERVSPRGVPAAELDKWTGLIAVGGDALEESERLYDVASCA